MKIDGHYDEKADIAWLRCEDYNPASVVAEETDFGLRELTPPIATSSVCEYRTPASGCRRSSGAR